MIADVLGSRVQWGGIEGRDRLKALSGMNSQGANIPLIKRSGKLANAFECIRRQLIASMRDT